MPSAADPPPHRVDVTSVFLWLSGRTNRSDAEQARSIKRERAAGFVQGSDVQGIRFRQQGLFNDNNNVLGLQSYMWDVVERLLSWSVQRLGYLLEPAPACRRCCPLVPFPSMV